MNIEKTNFFLAIKEIDKYFAKEVPAKLFGNSVSKISFVLKYAFACAQYPLWLKGSQLLLGFPIIWSFLLNWNVFRVYRLRATLWSTLWELIGGQRSRQLSDPRLEKTKSGRIHQSREDCGTGLDSLCLFYADRLQMSQFASDLSCSKCPPLCSKYKWISRALFKRVCLGKHSIASLPPSYKP